MKTLLLVRHAKSIKDDPTLADRDRPLADRGLKEALQMGRRLAERGVKPDLFVSSPALRALTTAQLIAEEVGYERNDIVVDDRLYESSADALLAVVRAFDKRFEQVMLFGHNPEFTNLAHRLSSDIVDMVTCAVAEFRFDTTKWPDVGTIDPAESRLDQPPK
ncbi:histidine phosphatase family protein [Piscinibacter sp. XHJ-5]|uniref:SixA phosphatase family protein n=1 Tax=Piscinibacter sp. XHJ-5 TaxID=3037797 RepID=UPI0024536492|nr:histidine phosphatase family protein [Piscinibacter sp. XHJ-5]